MKEKIKGFSLISVGILSAIILLWGAVNFLLPVLMPFLIAWLIAGYTRAPAERFASKTKMSARITRLWLSLSVVAAVIGIMGVVIWQIVSALREIIIDAGEGGRLYQIVNSILSPEESIFADRLPEEYYSRISQMLGDFFSSLMSGIAQGLTSIVTGLPRIFLFLLVTIISLVYFSLDYDRISGFVKDILPGRILNTASGICQGIVRVIGRYLRSYSIIMLITYTTLLAGFLLLSVANPFRIALLVAILDILPIIGVGTVLIPWGIFEIAVGNKVLGIGLIILFVVNSVIRQFAEPRIVGKSLNLHPIITLIMIYVGYALFGIVGLVILPILAVSIGVALKNNSSAQVD